MVGNKRSLGLIKAKQFLLGALVATSALVSSFGYTQAWTISETANVGGVNTAHVYHTTLTSPSVLTAPLTVGWNDCLVAYNVGSNITGSTQTSVSFVASPIAISTTTSGISGTFISKAVNSTVLSRTTVAGAVRTVWGVANYVAGASDTVILEIAQTKCTNR